MGHVRPRGISLPIDIFMTGSARFCKKAGNFLPVLIPQNTMRLDTNASAKDEIITTSFFVPGLTIGSVLSISRREQVTVVDYDSDTFRIRVTPALKESYERRTQVFLNAVPIRVVGTYVSGTSAIVVDPSPYRLYRGDVLRSSSIEYDINTYNIAGSNYQVFLSQPLRTTLQDGQHIYLRAWPAYESPILAVPTLPGSSKSLGPFVLDWVSSALVVEKDFEEIQTIQMYNASNSPLYAAPGLSAGKNLLSIRIPILAEQFLFWNIPLKGSMNYDGASNRLLATCDPQGRWEHGIDLVPNWPTDQINQWQMVVIPDSDCVFTFYFEPNAPQQFTLTGGTPNIINLQLSPTDNPAVRIRMLIRSQVPSMQARIGDMQTIGARVSAVSHTLVAKVDGEYSWASSGLFLKPLWPTLEYLRFTLNNSDQLNNGRIFL